VKTGALLLAIAISALLVAPLEMAQPNRNVGALLALREPKAALLQTQRLLGSNEVRAERAGSCRTSTTSCFRQSE
jgi:hypothetical protein